MNIFILVYLLVIAPKLLFDRLVTGKRHPGFLQRLGFFIPKTEKPVIWIHAVSVGEVKAAQPLFRELRKKYRDYFFLITTTSSTGQAEARHSLPEADAFSYLPLDLSWVVNRFIKRFNPKIFIFIESDFWPNLLRHLKKNKTKIVLASGKISERSFRRFHRISSFSKWLFSHFDLISVQNEEYLKRFQQIVRNKSSLQIGGNLKLDIQPEPIDVPYWRKKLSLAEPIITISCTHAPEEEILFKALKGIEGTLIIAPRHPERFEEVAKWLAKNNIPFFRFSAFQEKMGGERILLMDSMGKLPICYSLSRLAIVGGSFVERVGGHNILEPSLYNCPVIFGPHMFSQVEFSKRILESGAGLQITLELLEETIKHFFHNPTIEEAMKKAVLNLKLGTHSATKRTMELLAQLRV